MSSCSLKTPNANERMTRAKDLCNTCFKKPGCPIRMRGDFHIGDCSSYCNHATAKKGEGYP